MSSATSVSTGQTVSIHSYTHDGRGVATLPDNRKVFVTGALVGEQITVRNLRRRRNYYTADTDSVEVASEKRAVPPCEYFGTCGGCQLQHMSNQTQLEVKEALFIETLDRLAGISDVQLFHPVQTGSTWHYRRKARLGVRLVPKKGGVLVGFRERASSFVTNLNFCHTLVPTLSDCMPELATTISRLSAPNRVPQVEIAAGDKHAAYVFRHLTELTTADLNEIQKFGESANALVYLQPGGVESLAALYPKQPPPLIYRLNSFNLSIEFGPLDFVQINSAVNQAMIDQAVEWISPEAGDCVLDLFCGVGNITLAMARKAGSTIGIEGSASLVAKAKHNVNLNKVSNSRFLVADLEQVALKSLVGDNPIDTIVLDPPRSGALNVVKSIQDLPNVRKILYISCNPETLARDAGILVNYHKFKLQAASLIDMFPHTSHSEAMAMFTC